MALYEIHKQLQKRGGGQNVDRDYLEEVLGYYARLQVCYVSPEKEVMFL